MKECAANDQGQVFGPYSLFWDSSRSYRTLSFYQARGGDPQAKPSRKIQQLKLRHKLFRPDISKRCIACSMPKHNSWPTQFYSVWLNSLDFVCAWQSD